MARPSRSRKASARKKQPRSRRSSSTLARLSKSSSLRGPQGKHLGWKSVVAGRECSLSARPRCQVGFFNGINGLAGLGQGSAASCCNLYLTNVQDRCKIKVLGLASTGLKPGLVTVNLDFWNLTCSSPATANGEILRQDLLCKKVHARSVFVRPSACDPAHSRSGIFRSGTRASLVSSSQVRAAFCSFSFQPRLAKCIATAEVFLRAFIQMTVGLREQLPQRPPVFLFS